MAGRRGKEEDGDGDGSEAVEDVAAHAFHEIAFRGGWLTGRDETLHPVTETDPPGAGRGPGAGGVAGPAGWQ